MCNAKTLLTGIAPGVKGAGLLLDPLNLSGAAAGKPKAAPAPPDPAVERAAAEAEAAQKANRQIAEDTRRRREQGQLIARGAPQPTLGDTGAVDGLSPIGPTSRSSVARTASLVTRGAPAATNASFTPSAGTRSGGSTRTSQMAF